MIYNQEWETRSNEKIIPFFARYHHALVSVHPFDNGNGRWARLACDAVIETVAKESPIVWATDTLARSSAERTAYIAALKQADQFNIDPLTEYLTALNGER